MERERVSSVSGPEWAELRVSSAEERMVEVGKSK